MIEFELGKRASNVVNESWNTWEQLTEELAASLNCTQIRESEINRLETKDVELEEYLEIMDEGDKNKELIIILLVGELQE